MAKTNLSFKTAFKKFLTPDDKFNTENVSETEVREDQEEDLHSKDNRVVNKSKTIQQLKLLEENRVLSWEICIKDQEINYSEIASNSKVDTQGYSEKDQTIPIKRIKDFYVPMPFKKIVVQYLSCYTDEYDLEKYFENYGAIESCAIIRDQKTGKSLCSGYIVFENADEVTEVLTYCNHEINGRPVLVMRPNDESYQPIFSRKVVVRFLRQTTTEFQLQNYFKKFGEVESCVIMKNRKNRASLCYGYVIFEKADVACEVLKTPQHYIESREVSVSRPTNESLESEENRTMYIRNLDYSTCEDTVIYYFGMYGLVETCVIMREMNDRRKSKGFGFVLFYNAEMMAKALAEEPHVIDDRNISCCSEMDSSEIDRTIFLTNLDISIPKDTVVNHFKKYGVVETCVITQTGTKGRCKGFLIFQHNEMMAEALSDRHHKVGNMNILFTSKEENKSQEVKRTIIIEGIGECTSKQTLIKYFGKYGPIKKVFIARYLKKGRNGKDNYKRHGQNGKLYGYLIFNRYVKMDKLFSDMPHKIDGKITKCFPKLQEPDPLTIIQQARTFKPPKPIDINEYYGCGIDVFKINKAQKSMEIIKNSKFLEGQVGAFPNLPPSQPTQPLSERWDLGWDDERFVNSC